MVLLDLSSAALHLLAAHGAHWLPGQLHAADDGLEALVGKGRLLPIQLDDPGEPKAHLASPLVLSPTYPKKNPDPEDFEDGFPHLLTGPTRVERRQGRLRLHFTERETEAQRAGAGASGNGARQGQSWDSVPGSLVSTRSRLETETDRTSLITEEPH